MKKVLVINNDGGGFADYVEVAEDTTVEQRFRQVLQGANPDVYLIRVNRLPASADQVLGHGDRVSITPTRIQGAA
jgi:hypothetical protein